MRRTVPHVQLGDVLESIRAGVSIDGEARALGEGEHGILTLSAVAGGRFDPNAFKAVTANGRRLGPQVSAGTLLMSRSNTEALVGVCAYVERDYPRLRLPDLLWEIRIRPDAPVTPGWLHAVLATEAMRRALVRSASGTSGSMKKISMARLRRIALPAPDLDRQRRAVAWLNQADAVPLSLDRLREAKRRLKRALLQQLLTGARGLRGPVDPWRRVALADLADELSDRNGGRFGTERVMGVLKHEGLVPMRERTMADDLSRYKVVPPRAFAYNPMRINIGSIAYSSHAGDVLVSPDYEVFATRADRLDPRYLDHVRRTDAWSSFVKRAGNGSVRVRIYFQDLAQFVFPLPPLAEQQRIAHVLDTLDHEITLLDRQLAAYRQLKRGLMQQLLTGQLAIPEREPASTLPAAVGKR